MKPKKNHKLLFAIQHNNALANAEILMKIVACALIIAAVSLVIAYITAM